MSGEISNLYGINAYNNPYLNNNDDFLAQQYFAQQAGQIQGQGQTQNQPAFQGYQQPQADTFQKSGSGLTTGLTLGAIAGAGTGAGIYYFGTNPIKDGKFNENFLGALDEANYQDVLKNKKAELLTNAKKPILAKYKINDEKTLEAIKKFVEAEDRTKLPKEILDLVPADMKVNPKDAKIRLDLATKEIDEIKVDDINKEAEKLASKETLKFKNQHLNDLKTFESKISGLADDISKTDLEKFITENAESFGIKGDKAAIEAEAKRLAGKGKAELLTSHKAKITAQEDSIKATKESLGKMTKYWDDTAKAFKKDAPETLTKAYKSFKWNKALKGGGIAAGVALVLGYLFGSNA